MKPSKKHVIARLLVGLFLFLGIGFWASHFVVDAANWDINGVSRDNSNFLSATFWDANPSTGDIVKALYGSGDEGSVYTTNWSGYTSGSCLSGGMNVVFTGNLSLTTLAANTIYVLTGPVSTGSATINMSSCNAVISNTSTGTTFYSTVHLPIGMFQGDNDSYVIFDHIAVNGTGGGVVPAHAKNANGFYMEHTNDLNLTLHDVQAYNHSSAGIFLIGNYGIIQNSVAYNNGMGLYLEHGEHILLDNMHIYNNTIDGGIFVETSCTYCAFNNLHLHNNSVGAGFSDLLYSTLHNIQSYDNTSAGIQIYNSSDVNLHDITSYNNQYGIFINSSSVTYYDNLIVFDNQSNIHGAVITGLNGDLLEGRGDGILITTGTVGWEYITNSVNTLGDHLLPWTGNFSTLIGSKSAYLHTTTDKYSYGNNIMAQAQPVLYHDTNFITGGSYDATNFIGSQTRYLSGTISNNSGSYVSQSGISITLSTAEPVAYTILGDVVNEKTGTMTTTTQTGIFLSGNDGTKNIFVQLRSGDDWATHYVTSTILDTTYPTFTGVTANLATVHTGGYYNTTGITITFADTNLSGAVISGVNGNSYLNTGVVSGISITTGGAYLFTVYDLAGNSTGMIFTIDTTSPSITGTYPTSGQLITGSNTLVFTRTGIETNLSGYTLYISGTNNSWTGAHTTGGSSYSVSSIPNGSYNRYISGLDLAGNTGVTTPSPFIINVSLSGVIVISGAHIQTVSTGIFSKDTFPLSLRANKNCEYSITGDITSVVTGSFTGTTLTPTVTLSGTDGLKTIYVLLSTGSESVYKILTGYLDTTVPSTSTLLTPASGSTNTGATVTLTWSAATDTGVGLSGYTYFVSTTGTFATLTTSGFITGTSVSLSSVQLGLTGTFYRYVQSKDKLGWTGASSSRNFIYSGNLDLTPDTFTFPRVNNAKLDWAYTSEEEEIQGMTAGAQSLASISKGILYINDDIAGTTGYVENGDTVSIELISSDEYETSISSVLTIGNFTTTFRVTTKTENTDDEEDEDTNANTDDLSTTEKLQIAMIFTTLKDMYTDSTTRATFMHTLLSMLQTKIDSLNDKLDNGTSNDEEADQSKLNALQYLYDIVDEYLGGNNSTTTTDSSDRHTAPNGRVYMITYDSVKKSYTSPDFMVKKYFATQTALIAYIDANNGGSSVSGGGYSSSNVSWNHASIDTTRQSAPYTLSNGKTYYLFKTTDGRYSSYTFKSAKYFNTLDSLRSHIYNNNK